MKKIDKLLWTPSDWHSGSTTALATPSWTWGDGITVKQSENQSKIRKQHLENLKLIRSARKGRQLHIAFLGDAVDGNHHDTKQIISPDEDEHSSMFVALFEEALEYLGFSEKNGDTMRFFLGTDSHVKGREEGIAKYFYNEYGDACVPPVIKPTAGGKYKDGRFVKHQGMLDINGVLFDLAHQPSSGPGSREWTKENSIRSLIKSLYFRNADLDLPIINWWVRAHRHEYVRSGKFYGRRGDTEGVALPSKQLKTHHGVRVAADKIADIGDVWWTIDADGYDKMHKKIFNILPKETERI
jgi:hypothetical protein